MIVHLPIHGFDNINVLAPGCSTPLLHCLVESLTAGLQLFKRTQLVPVLVASTVLS
jgi:hypothetical protein